ncbi:carboxypeptidase-like regulatory domain-containing protein, partial [bacterium]|nr:carboxypeptidase-like regulatory domain-containing protein [bacterium]
MQTINRSGFINELYDNIPCFNCQSSSGTPIQVSRGDIVTGIDFELKKGGSISGTVFSVRGGTAGIEIYDAQGIWVDLLLTDDYGHYSVTGLHDRNYFVAAHDADLIPELYDNIPCPGLSCNPVSGTPIHIKNGQDISGIDFSLDLGGGIVGKLVDASSNSPIDNARVSLFDLSGKKLFKYGYANQYGNFQINGLIPGNYYLVAESDEYLDELYNNIPCFQENCDVTQGIPVPVYFGSITYGVNWELDLGGSISGKVTDAVNGELIDDAHVNVYDAAGNQVGGDSVYPPGEYSVGGLPTATYFLRANAHDMHIDQLYKNISCPFEKCDPLTGTPVSVTIGAETPEVNFALDLGGAIHGLIINEASSSPIPQIPATLFGSSGQELGSDFSNSLGNYSIEGIPSGDFF